MLSSQAVRAGLRAQAQLGSVSRNAVLNGARTYAAAAAPTQSVKPPIALFGIDGTYANALVRGQFLFPRDSLGRACETR